MKKYDLDDFIEGFNHLNDRKIEELSYVEIRLLMNEYEFIDPMISQYIYEAYVKSAAGTPPWAMASV